MLIEDILLGMDEVRCRVIVNGERCSMDTGHPQFVVGCAAFDGVAAKVCEFRWVPGPNGGQNICYVHHKREGCVQGDSTA